MLLLVVSFLLVLLQHFLVGTDILRVVDFLSVDLLSVVLLLRL